MILGFSSKKGNWLRSCCVCSASSVCVSWLCAFCWNRLESYFLCPNDMIRVQSGLTHIRLFDWSQDNDFFLRTFLKSLKGSAFPHIFDELSREILHRIIQVRSLKATNNIIPAPAKKLGLKDHAFCFASSLAQVTGYSLKNLLLRRIFKDRKEMFTKPQKFRNKRERRKVSFQLRVHFPCKSCIFVDDVLTTGATALAAYRALNKPSSFLIVTLAWRCV